MSNNNWILRAGVLHIAFAALHDLDKQLTEVASTLICVVECGTYISAVLRVIYGGKAYKRGVEYDIATSLAIMMPLYLPLHMDISVSSVLLSRRPTRTQSKHGTTMTSSHAT